MPWSQFWLMVTFFGGEGFHVENTQEWFTIPFFLGYLGTLQLVQGHTSWLYSQEAQWGMKLPASGSVSRSPKPLSYPASSKIIQYWIYAAQWPPFRFWGSLRFSFALENHFFSISTPIYHSILTHRFLWPFNSDWLSSFSHVINKLSCSNYGLLLIVCTNHVFELQIKTTTHRWEMALKSRENWYCCLVFSGWWEK